MEWLSNQKEAHLKGCAIEHKILIQGKWMYYLLTKGV